MKIKYALIALLLTCVMMGCRGSHPGTFEVGENTFLLNGKPFVVKAAEMHYPRIPREYWEHRIEMCKALGMNTICLYVFWNLHEQTPGNFDFSGNKDIAAFCRLAQKHGMYVIVRPGPYVCAEWEMGGLPWWLLKNDSVQLRTQDPFYMKHVGQFMRQVGKQLCDLQITRGGNIIMVQVENEYGAYATDKAYISAIRDTVRAAGFDELQLFQCDWSSNFQNNALDDLLWTVNFGTGADINAQFEKLRELRPNTPLMCSEYWSGWFDHWGRNHATRDGAVMVQGIRDMLSQGISFSLYMTHGGTTFGHWGGANNPAYSAMCSSYDYDAPISEAGWTTEKYFQLRDMLKEYLGEGEALPDVPEAIPVMAVPAIRFSQVAPLMDVLPQPKRSELIKPMEKFDQGWGSILYRTRVKSDVAKGTILKITEQHDWTQVFIDGTLVARLDRRKGEQECELPELKAGATIDLLVEAMGRVNFDRSIHDRKGITEKVELVHNGVAENLTGWEVFNYPTDLEVDDKCFMDIEKWQPATDEDIPAYYRATFRLDKTADTFLNMEKWGKGLVWVNGHCIGRFWEIGPQQTLYLPGCWLKKGENEIVVLDIKGPRETVVEGLERPILDCLRSETQTINIKQWNELYSDDIKPVWEGELERKSGWSQISTTAASGRYFGIEIVDSYDKSGATAIAELDVLGADGKPLSREKWRVAYVSSESADGNHTADKVYDLQESIYWLTDAKDAAPHRLVIDLGKSCRVAGFRIMPRAETGAPQQPKRCRVYVFKNITVR